MNKLLLIAALGVCAALAAQGVRAHKALTDKTAAQATVTANLESYTSNVAALSVARAQWVKNYRSGNDTADLVSLLESVNLQSYGLTTAIDAVVINKIEPVAQDGLPLGLVKICIGTAGSALDVSAPDYSRLLDGLGALLKRPDVSASGLTVRAKSSAAISDFCVQVRT